MNVLIIVDNFYPVRTAAAVRIQSFLTAIAKSGRHTTSLLAGTTEQSVHEDSLGAQHIFRPKDANILGFVFYIVRFLLSAVSAMRRSQVILITAPLFEFLPLVFPASLMGKKIVIDLRDSPFFVDYFGYLRRHLSVFLAKRMAKMLLLFVLQSTKAAVRLSAVVLVANEAILNEVNQLTKFMYKDKILLVENGISESFFQHVRAMSQERREKVLPLSFGYIGNFSERDRFEQCIELAQQMTREFRVVLIGEGREKKKVIRQLQAALSAENVVDLGVVDHADLARCIDENIDIGFIFRDSDSVASVPVSAIEMSSLSIPVIVNDVGEMARFVRSAEGFVVSSKHDIQQLATMLNTLKRKPRISPEKTAELRKKYSREKIAEKLIAKLDALSL